jgi:hypothetical protein
MIHTRQSYALPFKTPSFSTLGVNFTPKFELYANKIIMITKLLISHKPQLLRHTRREAGIQRHGWRASNHPWRLQ